MKIKSKCVQNLLIYVELINFATRIRNNVVNKITFKHLNYEYQCTFCCQLFHIFG